jgi:hypothetical protein
MDIAYAADNVSLRTRLIAKSNEKLPSTMVAACRATQRRTKVLRPLQFISGDTVSNGLELTSLYTGKISRLLPNAN